MTTKLTKWPLNLPIGRKIHQMAVKYTNVFNYKTLQNLPKTGFWVLKCTIWQPWHRLTALQASVFFMYIHM
jgi:hypothetical protein